ncbi:MAG: hypothetical protein J6Y78_16670 [Paludibacteraceae bacterium]|nr:hypothetical protein [Paludibacteraceae bacterium]
MSKRFFTKINKNGRNVIIDKECHIEIIDLTLACEVLNRLDTKRRWLNDENEQLKKQYAYVCQKLAEPIDLANLKYKDLVGRPTITRKELFGDE